MGWNESREEPVTKKIRLFDQEVGFYTLEIQNEELQGFPHLLNEAYVLGLSILQEENDDTWALGLDQLDGAVSPWFEDLQQLEEYCLQAGSREAMRDKKAMSRP